MSSSDKMIIRTSEFINNPNLNSQIEKEAEFEAEAEKLGSGSFGAVHLVKHIKTNQKLVFLIFW